MDHISDLKKYIQKYSKTYSPVRTLQLAVIFACIVLIIDINDMLSFLIKHISYGTMATVLAGICIFIILKVLSVKPIKLLKIKSVNLMDYCMSIIFIADFVYIAGKLLQSLVLHAPFAIHFALAILTALIFLMLILFRIHILTYSESGKDSGKHKGIYDLKDIYENKIDGKYEDDKIPLTISETDVDYDLFNRGAIINQLYYLITKSDLEQSFTVGLEGKWGSGKTTVINSVKAKLSEDKNIVIIDSFDPWIYADQRAILIGFFETILKKSGIRTDIKHSRRLESLLKAIYASDTTMDRLIKGVDLGLAPNPDIDIADIKTEIGEYIKSEGIKIVFFIDNLDRVSSSDMILLFKMTAAIFDIPRVFYVLSYDRGRVNDILEKTLELDPSYIEKIIQQEIKLPIIIENQKKDIFGLTIKNILKYYGEVYEEGDVYESIIDIVCGKVKDIRSFKRYINTVFSSVFCTNNPLCKRDLLLLETIRFFDLSLYYSIYENSKFYISYDMSPKFIHYRINKGNFNKEGKEYFDEVFSKYGEYRKIFGMIFPYAKNYLENEELISSYMDNKNYNYTNRTSSMCNAKFFELYFYYGMNDYTKINSEIMNTIKLINDSDNSMVTTKIRSIIGCKDAKRQREVMYTFYLHSDEIHKETAYAVIRSLYENIFEFNDDLEFFTINSKTWAERILAGLLLKCSQSSFETFLEKISRDYNKLNILNRIRNFMDEQREVDMEGLQKKRVESFESKYYEICESIKDLDIDIYSDEYYHLRNIVGLSLYFDENGDEESLKEYILYALDNNNRHVYRILGDTISVSVEDALMYIYEIDEDLYAKFIGDNGIIDTAIKNNPPETDSETFVFNIYKLFKEDSEDKEYYEREQKLNL